MVKVSITLPNAAQITLESEEAEVIHQVVSMALRDLPRELMHSGAGSVPDDGQADRPQGSSDVIKDVTGPAGANVLQAAGDSIVETAGPPPTDPLAQFGTPEPQVATVSGLASGPAAATPGWARTGQSAAPAPARIRREAVPKEAGNEGAGGRRAPTTEAEMQFAQFCASAAPLGDMRKVVVAAEGAERYLDMPSVDTTDLARLFDLAGWRTPHNFTQTLRNAARDKYRWLERVPGRSGRYSATQLGRTVTRTA